MEIIYLPAKLSLTAFWNFRDLYPAQLLPERIRSLLTCFSPSPNSRSSSPPPSCKLKPSASLARLFARPRLPLRRTKVLPRFPSRHEEPAHLPSLCLSRIRLLDRPPPARPLSLATSSSRATIIPCSSLWLEDSTSLLLRLSSPLPPCARNPSIRAPRRRSPLARPKTPLACSASPLRTERNFCSSPHHTPYAHPKPLLLDALARNSLVSLTTISRSHARRARFFSFDPPPLLHPRQKPLDPFFSRSRLLSHLV